MFAYVSTVLSIAKTLSLDSALQYDQDFRQLKAKSKSLRWDTIHQQFYLVAAAKNVGEKHTFRTPLPTNAHRDIASNIIPLEAVFETTAPLNTHVTSVRVSTLPKHVSPDQTSQSQQLPTPVNHHNLLIILRGYSDIDYVVCGFHNGFQLHYQGPNQSFQLSNSTSAHQQSKFLISYIPENFN